MKLFTLFLTTLLLSTGTWAADVCKVTPHNCRTAQKPPYPTLCSYSYDCTVAKPTFQNMTDIQLIKKMTEAGYDLKAITVYDYESGGSVEQYYFVK